MVWMKIILKLYFFEVHFYFYRKNNKWVTTYELNLIIYRKAIGMKNDCGKWHFLQTKTVSFFRFSKTSWHIVVWGKKWCVCHWNVIDQDKINSNFVPITRPLPSQFSVNSFFKFIDIFHCQVAHRHCCCNHCIIHPFRCPLVSTNVVNCTFFFRFTSFLEDQVEVLHIPS